MEACHISVDTNFINFELLMGHYPYRPILLVSYISPVEQRGSTDSTTSACKEHVPDGAQQFPGDEVEAPGRLHSMDFRTMIACLDTDAN